MASITLNDELTNTYKKICNDNSVNAVKPIESFMEKVIDKKRIEEELYNIISNIEDFKESSQSNLKDFNILDISDLDKEEKIKKIINRIIFASNKIDFSLRTGKANYCIIGSKYYSKVKPLLKKYIDGIKVIIEDKLGDNIIVMKLLSNDETKILKNYTQCDDNKCIYGFQIIDN